MKVQLVVQRLDMEVHPPRVPEQYQQINRQRRRNKKENMKLTLTIQKVKMLTFYKIYQSISVM